MKKKITLAILAGVALAFAQDPGPVDDTFLWNGATDTLTFALGCFSFLQNNPKIIILLSKT